MATPLIEWPTRLNRSQLEAVRERDRVGGGLGHGELAGLVLAGAVAAQVRENVGELRGVEVVGQVAPAEGGAEPAVQRDDMVVTGSDHDIGASHGTVT